MKSLLTGLLAIITVLTLNAQNGDLDRKNIFLPFRDIVHVESQDKIYAVTAGEGENGNSLCIVDPYFGTIDTCFYIGNEPSTLALSAGEEFLYIGFDGSPQVLQYDLDLEEVILTFNLGEDNNGPFFAEDIEVLPDDPNSVAVARKSLGVIPGHKGVAVYDEGVMRPNVTQNHTGGNSIAFDEANGGLHGLNNESTQGSFRTISLDANGLTETSLLSNVMPGSRTTMENQANRFYSTTGHVIEITENGPLLIGSFDLDGTLEFPSPGSITYDAVEPAPDTDLVYFVLSDFSGDYHNLEFFDKNTFVHQGGVPFNDVSGQLISLISWGDGGKLAFCTEEQLVILRSCEPLYTESLSLPPNISGGCVGDSVQLTAPDGLPAYHWSNGETTQTITVYEEGEYFFSVPDENGCLSIPSNPQLVDYDNPPVIEPDIEHTQIEICFGQSAVLESSGATSFWNTIWSTGEVSESIEVSSPGLYTVAYITENGCAGEPSEPVEVILLNDTIPDQPLVIVDGEIDLCLGDSTTLIAPDGFDYYDWSNGESSQSIQVDWAGSYSVQVASNLDCWSNPSESISIDVFQAETPWIVANGNTLTTIPAQEYQWFFNGEPISGANGQFYEATENGFYSVQVTISGCLSPISELYSHTLVSVSEDKSPERIKLFPNPAEEFIRIQLEDEPNRLFQRVELYNSFGQMVADLPQCNELNLVAFPAGLYFLKIYDVHNILIEKASFVKK